MQSIPTVIGSVPNIDMDVVDHNNDETFMLTRDTRHGKEGYRMLRHVADHTLDRTAEGIIKAYVWDERYMFFLTVPEALQAILTRDFSAAYAAF